MIIPVGKSFVVTQNAHIAESSANLPVWVKFIVSIFILGISLALLQTWLEMLKTLINYKKNELEEYGFFLACTAFVLGLFTLAVGIWFA